MLNSKHSVESIKILLVHSVTRYNDILRKSQLSLNDPEFQPLHYDENFKKYERKLGLDQLILK